jgi:NMD protein affecting ribosome stability and mRNA decay
MNLAKEWKDEPLMMVRCECGELYTLHLHTVCPRCFKWPSQNERVPETTKPEKKGDEQ